MAKDGKRFGPADQAAVVKALAAGASVAAAARAAGFCAQTLYTHRSACALFREAWDGAVAESARPILIVPRGGRAWQTRRARRNRFTRERKAVFLSHFALTCDAHASAEAAGVSPSTVFQHRREDPAFAQGWEEALAQGYARLEAEALRQRLEAMERIRFRAGDEAPPDAAQEFDRTLQLLREYKRAPGAARPGRAGLWSFEESFEALEKSLKAFGIRVEEEEKEDKEKDAPPPPCGWSPSPAKAGEDKDE